MIGRIIISIYETGMSYISLDSNKIESLLNVEITINGESNTNWVKLW